MADNDENRAEARRIIAEIDPATDDRLLQGAVEERRHPERGEDQRGRSDADEHQQLERERRDHPRVTADTAFQSVLDTAA